LKGNAKAPSPQVLIDWRAKNNVPPAEPNWQALMNPQKVQVHEALLAEQGLVCTYCGKRITTGYQSSHIEHFRPKSQYGALRFDWTNLFASCGPTGKANTPKTCGDAKGKWDPEGIAHVNPTDPQCAQRFSYDGNGAITPTTSRDVEAQTMIDKLRLDDSSLDLDRVVIIGDLERQIRDGVIDASNKADHIAVWRSFDTEGRFIGYGHVAARYLEDQVL
jgi:uncharacterized protein (TIGR02646 family)